MFIFVLKVCFVLFGVRFYYSDKETSEISVRC
jgi:hypothetical protein